MIIRKSQFSQYLQEDESAFILLIGGHIRQEQPDMTACLSDDTLNEMISTGFERARSYGFRSDEDLTAFVCVMFEIAPNFDEQPELNQALSNTSIPINRRFDSLFEPRYDWAWQEAEKHYDTRAWFREPSQEVEQP